MSTEFLNQLFSVKCWEKFTPIYKLSIFDLDRVTDISTRRMKARELWRNLMFWNLENIVLWIWSERSSLTSSLGCPCKCSVFKYFDLKKVDKHFSLYISVLMVVAYDHVVFLTQSDRIHVSLALNNSIWLVYYAD